MNQSVQLKVDVASLVSKLGMAFSGKSTFIAELMQNSRRAGANEIQLSYTHENGQGELLINDDGCGIANFQKILTLAASGWGQEIQEAEKPFGMGWFSCLFAGTHVSVESIGQKLTFATADALDFKELKVEPHDTGFCMIGTVIRLKGIALTMEEVDNAVTEFSNGFPIPVYLNGEKKARPHAIESLKAADCYEAVVEVPDVGLCAMHKKASLDDGIRIEVYLSGIAVASSGFSYGGVTVIHLDATKFGAKLPDRSELIDKAEQLAFIQKQLRGWWMARMEFLKASLTPEELFERYLAQCQDLASTGFMNDIPLLPGKLLKRVLMPCLTDSVREHQSGTLPLLKRDMVLSGEVVLCTGELDGYVASHYVPQIIASQKGWLHIEGLPEEHWAMKAALKLDGMDIPAVTFESKDSGQFWLGHTNCMVHIADSVTLSWSGHELVITDEPVLYPGSDVRQDVLVMPPGVSCYTAAAMGHNFDDEHGVFHENYFEEVQEKLSLLLNGLNKLSPSNSLKTIINNSAYSQIKNVKNTGVLVCCGADESVMTMDVDVLGLLEFYRKDGSVDVDTVKRMLDGLDKWLLERDKAAVMKLVHCVFNEQVSEKGLASLDVASLFEPVVLEFSSKSLKDSGESVLTEEIKGAVVTALDNFIASASAVS